MSISQEIEVSILCLYRSVFYSDTIGIWLTFETCSRQYTKLRLFTVFFGDYTLFLFNIKNLYGLVI